MSRCGRIVHRDILKTMGLSQKIGDRVGAIDVSTWAHMIGAACSEFFTERVGSCQPEIGDGEPQTAFKAEDVFWF